MKTSSDLHKHYSLLLGLIPPWLVTNVDLKVDQKIVEIDVQWPVEHQVECPECQRSCTIKDLREERRWRVCWDCHAFLKEGDEALKGAKYLFLKNPENMSDQEKDRSKSLRMDNLKAGRAWSIKETFSEFWTYSYQASAERFFKRWYWWATHSRLRPIIDVAKLMKRHLPNILTYLRHQITNAMMEGFNSKIQSIKANARG